MEKNELLLEIEKLTKEDVEKDCANGRKITDSAFKQFIMLCKQYNLNPYTKDAYIAATEFNGKIYCQVNIGKDGYFKIADSNPNYDGMQDGIIVKNKDGALEYVEGCVIPPECELYGGWARVYSKARKYPAYKAVMLSEYTQKTDKTLWGSKPATMINKVAKCHALRDMFPQLFAGTYDESEGVDEDELLKSAQTDEQSTKTSTTTKSQAKEAKQKAILAEKQPTVITKDVTVEAATKPVMPTLEAAMKHIVIQGNTYTQGKELSLLITDPEKVKKGLAKDKAIAWLKGFATCSEVDEDKYAAQVLLEAFEKTPDVFETKKK